MTLPPSEFQRMEYLLGKANAQGLSPFEESELRGYIGTEQPSARNKPLEDLITLGLILVGIYLFLKAIEK